MIDWLKKKYFLVRWGAVARRWPLERLLQTTDLDLTDTQKAALTAGIHSWRELIPLYMDRFGSGGAGDKQIYCFGVAHGSTVDGLLRGYKMIGQSAPHFHLYDSFEGLPAEDPDVQAPAVWHVGAFASPRDALEQRLVEFGVAEDERTIYEGWFSETLKSELVTSGAFKPAAYVDIDADLYNSTYEVLDFFFTHGLIGAGTMIGYDDWGDTDLWTAGESRAHKEIMEKYHVKCAQVMSWGEQPLIRKLFLVVAVG